MKNYDALPRRQGGPPHLVLRQEHHSLSNMRVGPFMTRQGLPTQYHVSQQV